MKKLILMSGILFLHSKVFADTESMSAMPILKESRTYVVPSKEAGEDLQDQRGFGDKEGEVSMMNLMMVEGSGYENMDMGNMKMGKTKTDGVKMNEDSSQAKPAAHAKNSNALDVDLRKSPSPAIVGANIYEFAVKDKDGKEMKGLKLTAKVYMLSMDMGTESPRVREIKPGLYQTKAAFSMSGPWALKIFGPASEKVIEVKVGK